MIEIAEARLTSEGDGAEVKRLFPISMQRMNFDPFVLWDHFFIQPGNGFPTHPHRGFEAITYLFQGAMEHKDNMGNCSTVLPGGAQRFTAGRGLEHSEMPAADGVTSGIQLWINLPKRLKQIDAEYQQVDAVDVPVSEDNGVRIHHIVGPQGRVELRTPVVYQDVEISAGRHFSFDVPDNFRGLVYVVSGELDYGDQQLTAGKTLFFADIGHISLTAGEDSRVMLCMGTPHGEPIRQYGPFVD
jgi:hypothetical protein